MNFIIRLFTSLAVTIPSWVSAQEIDWQKTIGGTEWDDVMSIGLTSDNGFILGGSSSSNISGDKTENNIGGPMTSDFWVVKLDSMGSIEWQNALGGTGSEGINSIQQTSDGGYICGGVSGSHASADKSQNCFGNWDYWLVKLDGSGNKQWDKTFGGSENDVLSSVKQTADGGYICGGWSESDYSGNKTEMSQGTWDYWVIKTDAPAN